MVRQLKSRIVSDWKAMLVVFIAGGAVVWHILACQESPMAFSPDGTRLAFVTMEPYEMKDDLSIQGPQAYRLMIVDGERQLQVLETSTKYMLSGPAFSPDGRRVCYLRVPLMPKAKQDKLKDYVKRRAEALKDIEKFTWEENPPDSKPAPSPPNDQDQTLPPVSGAMMLSLAAETFPPVPVSLVIRDVSTHSIINEWPCPVPMPLDQQPYLMSYLLTRPQYSPDGAWVYFSVGGVVTAVNTRDGARRILATSAHVAALSPDGKRLALLVGENDEFALGFVQTDGTQASYYRWPKKASLSGLTWADSKMVAVLEPKPGKEQYVHLVRTDGTTRKVVSLHLDVPEASSSSPSPGELAVSPDGRQFVVVLEKDVYFLRSNGQTITTLHQEDAMLAQPTFAPDSGKVAFKHLASESNVTRCDQIAYYTPQGKPIATVPVPALPPGTTRPEE